MVNNEKTNWSQSVAGVIIENNKVLLARHMKGSGKGKLIVPGGYVEFGESPQEALIREYFEETGLVIRPHDIVGIRFNVHDWYVVFSAEITGGEIKPDNQEISEVVWLDIDTALNSDDVPDLTKKLIESASKEKGSFSEISYDNSRSRYKPSTFYGVK